MDPRLVDQRRYLAALEAAAASQPAVHRCQLAALARERVLAASSDDPVACRVASGDLFELARAAWLDRLLAHARVAVALDDPWTVQAAAIELEATLAARGHADWTATLVEGSARAAPWHARAAEARASFAALVTAVVRAAWDRRAASQAETRSAAVAAWQTWSALEPAARDLPAALARPRYRARTPWTGPGVAALIALVEGAALPPPAPLAVEPPDGAAIVADLEARVARWRDGLAHAAPGPLVGGEPAVADVIAPYAGLAALPGDAPVTAALAAAARRLIAAAAGARTPQAVMAAWTEADLLAALAAAPVRAHAEATLARQAVWPEPVLAAGARALLDDLSGTRTGTDVDLVSMHHGACAAIEADWNGALGGALLAPVEAAAIAGWDPGAAAIVAPALATARALTGAAGALLAVPRVQTLARVIAARDDLPPELGAWLGEQGHAAVGEARAWFAVRGIAARDEVAVRAALREAWRDPPAGEPRAVRLWDTEVALDDLARVPARPPVPGRSRPAAP